MKPEPAGKTSDGRLIYRFKIEETTYDVRDPMAAEIKAVEVVVAKKYASVMREGIEAPEGWEIDARFTTMAASIISPIVTVEHLRKLSRGHYYALMKALDDTIEINSQPVAEFFPKPDLSSPVSGDARIRLDFSTSGDTYTEGLRLSTERVQMAEPEAPREPERKSRKHARGPGVSQVSRG